MKRMRSWAVIGLLSLVPIGISWAGTYEEITDKLTGKVTTYYQSPMKDSLLSSLKVAFGGYDPSSDNLVMVVQGLGGDVNCLSYPIRLKSADGTVHQVRAEEVGRPTKCRAVIPAAWVKSEVTIEAVTNATAFFTYAPTEKLRHMKLNTADLDLARISSNGTGDSIANINAGAPVTPPAVATDVSAGQGDFCTSGAGGNVQVFSVKVISADWNDRLLRPGMEQVPPNALEMMGEGAYLRPAQKFLVVKLQITNSSNAPVAWDQGYNYSHVYYLINSQGARFQFDPRASDILRKAHSINLNPGIPTDGLVVFDVPQGSYKFEIDRFVEERKVGKVYECFLGT